MTLACAIITIPDLVMRRDAMVNRVLANAHMMCLLDGHPKRAAHVQNSWKIVVIADGLASVLNHGIVALLSP
jgi:hypothetical protein